MKITKLEIPEIVLFEPKVFGDDRGFFFESFNNKIFEDATGLERNFVQDNHSKSAKGVLRGLHFQKGEYAQGKLVRVVKGEVFDVAVDIRKGSETFGKWVGAVLSEQNKRQLWVPEGFAHGFVTLTDDTEFLYKTTNYYYPEHEASIVWDDKDLAIDWSFKGEVLVSKKDKAAMSFEEYKNSLYL